MIRVTLPTNSFTPGTEINCALEWDPTDVPRSRIEVRLLWMISGWNKPEIHQAATIVLEQPGHTGQEMVRFQAPLAPLSYAGELFSIEWVLEAVAEPSRESDRVSFALVPVHRSMRVAGSRF
jgi:hypothetical protein